MNPLAALAARNNALWCDAVSSSRGGGGEFHDGYWIDCGGAVPFYPDLVTLDADTVGAQQGAVRALAASSNKTLFVKDSFMCLDLTALGFAPLFDAEWIAAPGEACANGRAADGIAWRRVVEVEDLSRWECARSGSECDARLFQPALLWRPEICFVLGFKDNVLVGGFILNKGAGMAGASNVFSREIDASAVWQGLRQYAGKIFPGLPLVGYERGEAREAARCAGFSGTGPLRVWRRA